MNAPRYIACLSGGLDSVVAVTAAARKGRVELALTFDYGQTSARAEKRAARRVADALGIAWRPITLGWLSDLLPSALAEGGDGPPPAKADDLDDIESASRRARAVWVPNRNGLFINIAACHAERAGADAVVVGFNKEEAATFPDNSRRFMKRAEAALGMSTMSGVRVESPTAGWDKRRIAREGVALGAPLTEVWSCYEGGARMCGRCESCARLIRALDLAKVPVRLRPRALPAG